MNKKGLLIIARILIIVSFGLMIGGVLYNYKYNNDVVNPVKDTTRVDDDRTVSITTVDDEEEIVPEEEKTEEVEKKPEKEDSQKESNKGKSEKSSEKKPSTGSSSTKPSGSTGSSSSKPSSGGNTTTAPSTTTPTAPAAPVYPTIDETNNNLRVNLQNTYGITIKYGSETNGYSVGGLGTTSISNSYTIQTALNNLSSTLSLYPRGFFQEIKNGGIPLTLYLIKSYSQTGVTGATDSNLYRATISIAVDYPFAATFHHEVYHYMDRYIEKRGATYNKWSLYNPSGFTYNQTMNNSYSYSSTANPASYFVNNYAQTSAAEDRASTFEYMMAGSKISCFNAGQPIWNKAQHMSEVVDLAFNTVYPNVTEYWERHLY